MSGGRVQRAHRVTAIFHDAELSFDLARDATLAKLAEQLSPAVREQTLMEEICDRENLLRAWKRVRRNKGSPGILGERHGGPPLAVNVRLAVETASNH